jgi:hypothetical protein
MPVVGSPFARRNPGMAGTSNDRAPHARRSRVSLPPGALVISLAEFLLSRRSYQRARASVDELREEWFEAIATGRRWKGRWIRLRFACGLTAFAIASLPRLLMAAVRRLVVGV